jgi:hypothetical protein
MPLVFDVNDTASPVWRTYDGDVAILVNPITRDDLRRLRRQARVQGARRGPGIDEKLLDRLIYRHIVADWRGIVTPDGQPIECTPDMVDQVLAQLPVLAEWIAEQAATLAEDLALQRGDALKNSNASQDTNKTDPPASGPAAPAP